MVLDARRWYWTHKVANKLAKKGLAAVALINPFPINFLRDLNDFLKNQYKFNEAVKSLATREPEI